jgi:Uma2 family endonuclease
MKIHLLDAPWRNNYDDQVMASLAGMTTADQLLHEPGLGRCELLRGELVLKSPSGSLHAIVAATLARILGDHVEKHKLGWVFGAEGGFQIGRDPDTVRAPDAAFVSAGRMPSPVPDGFFPGPPDLAVDVLSPNDRASEVLGKVSDWLEAGCRSFWVVDPRLRSIAVYARQVADASVAPLRHAYRRGSVAGISGRGPRSIRSVAAGEGLR